MGKKSIYTELGNSMVRINDDLNMNYYPGVSSAERFKNLKLYHNIEALFSINPIMLKLDVELDKRLLTNYYRNLGYHKVKVLNSYYSTFGGKTHIFTEFEDFKIGRSL